MKPLIPHPLGMHPTVDRRPIDVLTVAPPWSVTMLVQIGEDEFEEVDLHAFAGDEDAGATCRSRWELGHLASDLVTTASPRWLTWAVSEALAGRLPRTQCYLAPVLSGGKEWDLGRGPIAQPMVFGGAWCLPDWPDGQGCDDPDPHTLPDHAALVPRRRPIVEDAGDVVFDDFELLGWPAILAKGGAA